MRKSFEQKEKYAVMAYDSHWHLVPVKTFGSLEEAGAELERMTRAQKWATELKYFTYNPQPTGPNFDRTRADQERNQLLADNGGTEYSDLVYLDGWATSWVFRTLHTPSHIIQMWEI